MKTFKFRMNTFMKLRKQEENIKKLNLARESSQFQQVRQVLDDIGSKEHQNRLMPQSDTTALDITELSMQGEYQRFLAQKRKKTEQELESCLQAVETAQTEFSKAKKESKVLELLEERQKREYKRIYSRQRQVEICEQSNVVWRKNNGT